MEEIKKFKEDSFAKTIAFLYFLAFLTSSALSTTVSPISESLIKFYSFSNFTIFALNSSYPLFFVLCNLIANYTIDNYGIIKNLYFSIILCMIGAWMRVFINIHSNIFILGHIIMAIANPFLINLISKVSNQWFTSEERLKMTSLMASGYMFGLGTGFLLISFFISDTTDSTFKKTEISNLMVLSAVLFTLTNLPVIYYFKDKPDGIPSISAVSGREENMLNSVSILFKNRDFMLLNTAFSIALSNFITIILSINLLLKPFNFTEAQLSYIGLIINFSSGTSKCFIAFIAGKYISMKRVIMASLGLITVSFLFFNYSLQSGFIFNVYLSSLIFGFFCQMYWGPALEYACELVFPVSESHANGNLLICGAGLGVVTNAIVSVIFSENLNFSYFMMYLLVSYLATIYFVYLIDDKLNRVDFEKNANLIIEMEGKDIE